jgi:hypothetical protein
VVSLSSFAPLRARGIDQRHCFAAPGEEIVPSKDVRDVHLAFLTVDAKWDPYRSDPEFVGLLERCAFDAAVS